MSNFLSISITLLVKKKRKGAIYKDSISRLQANIIRKIVIIESQFDIEMLPSACLPWLQRTISYEEEPHLKESEASSLK